MKSLPEHDFGAPSLGDSALIRKILWEQSAAYDDTVKHTHKYSELLFFINGDGTHELGYQKQRIRPRSVHVVNSGVAHRVNRVDGTMGFTLAFYRSAVIEEESLIILDILGLFQPYLWNIDFGTFQRLEELVSVIPSEYRNPLKKSDLFLFNGILEIIVDYVKEQGIIESGKINWFKRFLQYLSANRENKPRAHHLADHLNMSVEHLNALCNSNFQCSTEELIARYLIEYIKRDLMFTNKSIKELAYDLGFHDPSHFVKYFRKIEGRTPGQFRKSVN